MTTIEDFVEKTLPDYNTLVEQVNYLLSSDNDLITHGSTDNFEWVRVEDGAGNEGVIVLFPTTREALVYGYDHESDLNYYGEPDAKTKQVVFEDAPAFIHQALVSGDLDWDFAPGFVYATCGFWFIEKGWHYSNAYKETTDWEYESSSAAYVLKLVLGRNEN